MKKPIKTQRDAEGSHHATHMGHDIVAYRDGYGFWFAEVPSLERGRFDTTLNRALFHVMKMIERQAGCFV